MISLKTKPQQALTDAKTFDIRDCPDPRVHPAAEYLALTQHSVNADCERKRGCV